MGRKRPSGPAVDVPFLRGGHIQGGRPVRPDEPCHRVEARRRGKRLHAVSIVGGGSGGRRGVASGVQSETWTLARGRGRLGQEGAGVRCGGCSAAGVVGSGALGVTCDGVGQERCGR